MALCTYPQCGITLVWTEEPNPVFRESLFCTKHFGAKCNFPPCTSLVAPKYDVCANHQDMVAFFDWIHKVRHAQDFQRAMQEQRAQQMAQRILSPNGHPMNLKR